MLKVASAVTAAAGAAHCFPALFLKTASVVVAVAHSFTAQHTCHTPISANRQQIM
jgi:hypothetical protein